MPASFTWASGLRNDCGGNKHDITYAHYDRLAYDDIDEFWMGISVYFVSPYSAGSGVSTWNTGLSLSASQKDHSRKRNLNCYV